MILASSGPPGGDPGGLLGTSWAVLGRLGGFLGGLGGILDILGPPWRPSWTILGELGGLLGPSWRLLGRSWEQLGAQRRILRDLGGLLGDLETKKVANMLPTWLSKWSLNHVKFEAKIDQFFNPSWDCIYKGFWWILEAKWRQVAIQIV